MTWVLPLILTTVLVGCANPLNEATAARYSSQCSAAEAAGNLRVAEEACYRAVKNSDWGVLSPELKSQYLYNFARIERRLAKFADAEQLLRESLAIEEPLAGSGTQRMGRRLVELSVNLAAQDKWAEGEATILRVLPIAPKFTGTDRSYTREIYLTYSVKLRELARTEAARTLIAAAEAL